MIHTFEPGDDYSGFPEEYYFHDSLRNGFQNSLVCASGSALETYRAHRTSTRRSDATVAYRCDRSNGCLLMEVIPAGGNEHVIYLPGFHVSRSEAERMGCALRVYWERARRFSILDNPPRPVGEWPNAKSLGFYDNEEIELVCRHYILEVGGRGIREDVRTGAVKRFLPLARSSAETRPRNFWVRILADRWDQPDYSDLREARARYCKQE